MTSVPTWQLTEMGVISVVFQLLPSYHLSLPELATDAGGIGLCF